MARKPHLNKFRIFVIALSIGLMAWTISAFKPGSKPRKFTITQTFTAELPKENSNYKIWVPIPSDSHIQQVTQLEITSPVPFKETRDASFGNRLLFLEGTSDRSKKIDLVITYDIERVEQNGLRRKNKEILSSELRKMYLQPRGLVIINDEVKGFSKKATAGKTRSMEKAKGIYNYVFDHMSYDKSGKGWGRGDVVYACDIAKGNCTDFHSLFIAMMRSVDVPARFKMGFPLKKEAQGKLTGYHCWAEFYDDKRGWVPVDISEAWKNPKKKKYFFGRLDENRFEMSTGRHANLNPRQTGPAFNWLLLPHMEVDGKPALKTNTEFKYKSIKGV